MPDFITAEQQNKRSAQESIDRLQAMIRGHGKRFVNIAAYNRAFRTIDHLRKIYGI